MAAATKKLHTPTTDIVQQIGFDLTLPCGTSAAQDSTGYTRQEVLNFAQQLGITVKRKSLDCLCDEIHEVVKTKDVSAHELLRNTERNTNPRTPSLTPQHYMHQCKYNNLSPAVTPLPFGLMRTEEEGN